MFSLWWIVSLCGYSKILESDHSEEYKNKWRNLRENYRKNQNKKKTRSAASVSKYDDERIKFINASFEESECIPSLNPSARNVLEVHQEDNLKIEKYSEPSTSSTQMSSGEPFLKQSSQEGHSITPNSRYITSEKEKKKQP
ncbi:unnamed protein product [Euphydryas editha]|uniref:MADF domain-containing protein n=1 Tax=Euphydryas editha TaxID=104508 RepID=A0AAU9UQY4_EUPED|nr:unnamed protein product [Euphydryas editha]